MDALRLTHKTQVCAGTKVKKLNVTNDINKLILNSQQARDIDKFRDFSAGYLSYIPKEQLIIDVRYSYIPNEINPLWGINQISIGMNWNPIDKHSIKYNSPLLHNIGSMERIKQAIDVKIKQIEKRKKRWDVQVENHPSPYQYLKENVHNTE